MTVHNSRGGKTFLSFLPPFIFPQGGNVWSTPSPVGEGWEGDIK